MEIPICVCVCVCVCVCIKFHNRPVWYLEIMISYAILKFHMLFKNLGNWHKIGKFWILSSHYMKKKITIYYHLLRK